MGLKDLHLKLKAFRVKRFRIGDGGSKRKSENGIKKKPSWMMPISHGYHVMEHKSFTGGSDESDFDSVVVQREQIDELELWFFGVFDAQIGDGVTKYIQSHFFDKKPKESQINRKSKETMRKAYLGARAKVREALKEDETLQAGSASLMLINGEKLVTAYLGGYRAVVCRDGVAHQMSSKYHGGARRHWSRRLFPVRILVCDSSNAAAMRHPKSSELVVAAEKVDSETEFIIIASTGIWDVMKNQEAVNLIRHLEDPQEAAECLTKEALARMSKSNISCIVIRFD
ncbi:phosphatase 2C (PP2C)-like protein [Corchorus olitorius]|uniref:Phosphatase 2C (PP2C)-like protein n=1 Tax=Corchorus olitorius TaxID=93759 RepID=A0A1R3JKR8_9ROSI|nr:phosphatase 2C (PP2C)-like protein [Corchorus olitorius]